MVKGGQTGGVKPMSIAGRFTRERERLLGMTDEERAFRKQWLKDQELAPSEPRHVPQMYEATHNPIRRAYRWPLEKLKTFLEPIVGPQRALSIRYFSGKIAIGIGFVYIMTYYFKYNANDWTRTGGWRAMHSRTAILPGDPGYPKLSEKSKGSDYATRGFDKCKLDL